MYVCVCARFAQPNNTQKYFFFVEKKKVPETQFFGFVFLQCLEVLKVYKYQNVNIYFTTQIFLRVLEQIVFARINNTYKQKKKIDKKIQTRREGESEDKDEDRDKVEQVEPDQELDRGEISRQRNQFVNLNLTTIDMNQIE